MLEKDLQKQTQKRNIEFNSSPNPTKSIYRLDMARRNGEFSKMAEERRSLRVKFVVRKQDLNQILEGINDGKSTNFDVMKAFSAAGASTILEKRLHDLVIIKQKRVKGSTGIKVRCQHPWSPSLRSIPEV